MSARIEELEKGIRDIYEDVNALGGSDVQSNSYDQGIVDTVRKALQIIENVQDSAGLKGAA